MIEMENCEYMLNPGIGAILSEDRIFRYALWRTWGNKRKALLICGINPSVACETFDDNTITKGMGFACSWGYTTLIMVNLFGYRSTDPEKLRAVRDAHRTG